MEPPRPGPFPHDRPDLTGVVLVNLGTPAAPTTSAVRRYLAEFLADPRVVELPRWLWRLVLHGYVLRVRPRRSAAKYRAIWTSEGSPLATWTERLVARVRTALDPEGARPLAVVAAMRYGEPALARVLRELSGRGLRRLLVVPLYPQYSATTTASVFDAVARELSRWRAVPELRFVQGYHDDPGWVDAVAERIREHWMRAPRGERLVFSFHGIPQRGFERGDPYHCLCHASARAIAARLGLSPHEWTLGFQSRVGRARWLEPATIDTLAALARDGVRRVDVVCPGFAVDCLETLEEIAIENRAAFLAAGGERFDYVPALNDSDAHVAALAALVRRHGHGWDALAPSYDIARERESLALRAERAAALKGAT